MPDRPIPSSPPLTRKEYTPAFKAECVRQVVAGARQTDVARAQGLSPALLGRWQRQVLAEAVPSSAEHDEIKRLRAELKRVEQERDMLNIHERGQPVTAVMGTLFWKRRVQQLTPLY